jgi:small neutral amino acid transporter SnatA (MarC family)
VLSSHVAQSTLPFTGIALGAYVAIGGGLVLTGIAMRLLGRAASRTTTDA